MRCYSLNRATKFGPGTQSQQFCCLIQIQGVAIGPSSLRGLPSISHRVTFVGLVLSRVRARKLGGVTRPNLGLILRSACYSAGLGLDLKAVDTIGNY